MRGFTNILKKAALYDKIHLMISINNYMHPLSHRRYSPQPKIPSSEIEINLKELLLKQGELGLIGLFNKLKVRHINRNKTDFSA